MIIAVAVISALGGGGLIGAVLTYFGKRGETKVDNWSELAAAYSRQIADMASTYGALEARMSRVEADLDSEQKRSNAAIGYIRVLRRWICERYPDEDLPDVPDALRNDV